MRKRPTFLSMNWARDHYCAELLTLINYCSVVFWRRGPWSIRHALFVRDGWSSDQQQHLPIHRHFLEQQLSRFHCGYRLRIPPCGASWK